jgi:hypothetical protein
LGKEEAACVVRINRKAFMASGRCYICIKLLSLLSDVTHPIQILGGELLRSAIIGEEQFLSFNPDELQRLKLIMQ